MLRRSFASFGGGSVLGLPIRLAGTENIRIGSGVWIGGSSWLQVIDAPDGTPHARKDVVLDIGDNVRMSGFCVLSAAHDLVVEAGALFARNVYIADHGHAFDDDSTAIVDQGIDGAAPVRIGAGAWLGQNVVVLPGTTIGRGSVIGANSVVRGTIPDRSIAVGAPARVVRSLEA